MDAVILGLLMAGPLTSYELQALIRERLSMICSASAGSVQAALKRLAADGRVVLSEAEGPRRKRTVAITEEGKSSFRAWICEPLAERRGGDMGLAKLYFLDYAPADRRAAVIRARIGQLKETKAALEAMEARASSARERDLAEGRVSPWETLSYGIAAADFEISWFEGLLARYGGEVEVEGEVEGF